MMERRAALLASLAIVALGGLRSLLTGTLLSMTHNDSAIEGEQYRRHLLNIFDTADNDYVADENDATAYDAAFDLASEPARADALDDAEAALSITPLPPYTLEDALAEAPVFESIFAIGIYDPSGDAFVGFQSKDHPWRPGNRKLGKSMNCLAYLLRKMFPERFCGVGCEEFVFAIGGGDFPHVRKSMLPHSGKAPVLMFGSAFRDPNVYTNMMAMPMPQPQHLYCFKEWAEHDGSRVCKQLKPNNLGIGGMGFDDEGDLVFGKEYGLEWDDLIPQVIWRGTDFGFLSSLQKRPLLVHPDSRKYVPTGEANRNKRINAIKALNESYDTLLPRWKGAALTADAELKAHQQQARTNKEVLPWANIKMSSYLNNGKSPTVGSLKYSGWESVGIGVDTYMSHADLAKFKYHIDLGGGGGTTWSGTIEKLAMPGLLFHHVTPTRDYIHDRIKAWRHYIPVRSDLKDLKAKFNWAESHPDKAKRIADEGAKFMRQLGTLEGFGQIFDEDFVEPLRKVIDAYRPVSSVHHDKSSWQEVLQSMGDDCRIIPVMECSGLTPNSSCKLVGGDAVTK